MQELLLWAQVPANRHDLTLSVLAGVASLQPSPLAERHLLFRPRRQVGTAAERTILKRAAELDISEAFITTSYFINAVGDLAAPRRSLQSKSTIDSQGAVDGGQKEKVKAENTPAPQGSEKTTDDVMLFDDNKATTDGEKETQKDFGASKDGLDDDFLAYPWSVEFRDFPVKPPQAERLQQNQGDRQRPALERPTAPATQRGMCNTSIPHGVSPTTFLDKLGFGFSGEHFLAGHRLTYGDIDLRLYRVYGIVPAPEADTSSDAPASTQASNSTTNEAPSVSASIPVRTLSTSLEDTIVILQQQGQPPKLIPIQMKSKTGTNGSNGTQSQSQHQQDLKIVDTSGTYILQARLAIADSDPKLKKQGERQMQDLYEKLKGFVELKLGSYLQMDTRILVRQDG